MCGHIHHASNSIYRLFDAERLNYPVSCVGGGERVEGDELVFLLPVVNLLHYLVVFFVGV